MRKVAKCHLFFHVKILAKREAKNRVGFMSWTTGRFYKESQKSGERGKSMNKIIETADIWIDKVNAKDVKGVFAVSKSTIEMVGPHGTAAGLETLGQWVEESGIQLSTLTRYAKEDRVVYEQKGTWNDQAGEVIVYTFMEVKDGRVARVSRHETLEEALGDSGLSEVDKIPG